MVQNVTLVPLCKILNVFFFFLNDTKINGFVLPGGEVLAREGQVWLLSMEIPAQKER